LGGGLEGEAFGDRGEVGGVLKEVAGFVVCEDIGLFAGGAGDADEEEAGRDVIDPLKYKGTMYPPLSNP